MNRFLTLSNIAQVIKVPKMGDSISEGTVQSLVKSKLSDLRSPRIHAGYETLSRNLPSFNA